MKLAEQHQERLSERGKEIFAEGKQRLLEPSPFPSPLPIPGEEIDLQKLESLGFSHGDWYHIALVAETRQMFVLAEYAYDRSMPFIDPDTEKDKCKMDKENAWAFHDWKKMRAEAEK